MTVNNLDNVFVGKLKLENLMSLNISHNKLTDEAFFTIQKLFKESKKLSCINLSFNKISLMKYIFIN